MRRDVKIGKGGIDKKNNDVGACDEEGCSNDCAEGQTTPNDPGHAGWQ
jgi:hypothetical protein